MGKIRASSGWQRFGIILLLPAAWMMSFYLIFRVTPEMIESIQSEDSTMALMSLVFSVSSPLIGLFMFLFPLLAAVRKSETAIQKDNLRQEIRRQEASVLREIQRDEMRTLREHWARQRENIKAECDACGRPAVEAKEFKWSDCGHGLIVFACERCGVPYAMPCPTCAEERKIYLTNKWRWLKKAAAHYHVRNRIWNDLNK